LLVGFHTWEAGEKEAGDQGDPIAHSYLAPHGREVHDLPGQPMDPYPFSGCSYRLAPIYLVAYLLASAIVMPRNGSSVWTGTGSDSTRLTTTPGTTRPTTIRHDRVWMRSEPTERRWPACPGAKSGDRQIPRRSVGPPPHPRKTPRGFSIAFYRSSRYPHLACNRLEPLCKTVLLRRRGPGPGAG
jgi:hypothetical protein